MVVPLPPLLLDLLLATSIAVSVALLLVALQLERRIAFRRAMKKAVQTTMTNGADGIRIRLGGRLGGAEIARVESARVGRVPLHTLRENIDYGFTEARTLAGKVGIKCWICTKESEF